ncbi:rRNA maturation RNase YbeY [Erysipelothrix rhusiopathiae]|uniref:Endoribonuclease YbeY n=1 Tax=Erysipelothrix rhusiopathiae ATCC 19414 TaxID=525280 RepID=E7FUB5_ERYRH|nr:rRNA maturation RNase YbeY [Erysipelothrix rhusiopathiae]UPU39758.1 rRNA maturation RNase YbeY [Erysipelothrix sp. Poltava]AGN24181.1 putative metalloprotease [Erysipelothrix rhusiopathiae SY1027]AMS11040.1 rRNA maturation RNase YbeY [Erysipelothrix rhusiopathiae]AOO67538.1 rRNA maturation RNase YbeY [Erysipelothrix rhusiopathiae]AWU41596.1 rRNA maturation RNase YbeY [Erysipelothrix rhusiopathiae]
MEINYINQSNDDSWDAFETYLSPILEETLNKTGFKNPVEVNVVLVDDPSIHNFNKEFRDIDRPTDVLSFEDGSMEGEVFMMGDIIISVDAIRRQAEEYGHSIKREFCFLVAHGYLHLLGYDHHTPEEEVVMFGLQKEILHDIARKDS